MLQSDPVFAIAILLGAALIGGIIAHRLKQPVILGYLIIGAIVGPHSLGIVGDVEIVKALAAIGVTLLMFTLGLEISISQLKEVGKVGLWGGILQIAVTFIGGMALGVFLFHWALPQSALFGLIISLSSTAVCMKILMERGEISSVHGRIMLAILILQDVSVVIMMVILPVLDGVTGNLPMAVMISTGKGFLFVIAATVIGRWLIPWLLGSVGGTRTRELFLLTILVVCLAAAIGTQIAGLSVVFGAFIIGLVIRDTRFMHEALAEITPLRDIFSTLFFVSLGMLLDPYFLLAHWQMVLAVVAIIIGLKALVVSGVIKLFGFSTRIAVLAGAGLFQISEFGFVLAQSGLDRGFITDDFYHLIISAAILTMLITPVSVNVVSRSFTFFGSRFSGRAVLATSINPADPVAADPVKLSPVVIAGYGSVGEGIARGLEDAEIPFLVIELDPGRLAEAKRFDYDCIYGDACNLNVLSRADMKNTRILVITYPDVIAVETTVKNALKLNPNLKILARVHSDAEAEKLKKLGVFELISPEYEASFRFIKRILNLQGIETDRRRRILGQYRDFNIN